MNTKELGAGDTSATREWDALIEELLASIEKADSLQAREILNNSFYMLPPNKQHIPRLKVIGNTKLTYYYHSSVD